MTAQSLLEQFRTLNSIKIVRTFKKCYAIKFGNIFVRHLHHAQSNQVNAQMRTLQHLILIILGIEDLEVYTNISIDKASMQLFLPPLMEDISLVMVKEGSLTQNKYFKKTCTK